MKDPRILTFRLPYPSGTTKFNIEYSADQQTVSTLKVGGVTDLDVSLITNRQYVLDGINNTDDTSNNRVAASTPPNYYRYRFKVASAYGSWSDWFVFPSPDDFVAGLQLMLGDPAYPDPAASSLLRLNDYLRHLANSVEAFETVHPQEVVQTFALTNNIIEYELPDLWNTDFSAVTRIEYPTSLIPRRWIAPDYIWIDEIQNRWQFRHIWPTSTESAAVYYAIRHARDGSTVPVPFFESVLHWAAGDCAEQLRSISNQTGNPIIGASYVSLDPKVKEWAKIAESYKTQAEKIWGGEDTGYRTHLDVYDEHGVIPPIIWFS